MLSVSAEKDKGTYDSVANFSLSRGKYEREEDNAEFVAHSITDLPAALKELDAKDEEIERLQTRCRLYMKVIGTARDELENC